MTWYISWNNNKNDQENNNKNNQNAGTSHQKPWRTEDNGMVSLIHWAKKSRQPRIQHAAKPSFKNENEIKVFSDKQIREFIISRPAVQKMLKQFFSLKEKWLQMVIQIYRKAWISLKHMHAMVSELRTEDDGKYTV